MGVSASWQDSRWGQRICVLVQQVSSWGVLGKGFIWPWHKQCCTTRIRNFFPLYGKGLNPSAGPGRELVPKVAFDSRVFSGNLENWNLSPPLLCWELQEQLLGPGGPDPRAGRGGVVRNMLG